MLVIQDLELLACPACRGKLTFTGRAPHGRLEKGTLRCGGCSAGYPVERGLARLYNEQGVHESDRLLRFIYNRVAPVHDAAVKYTLPLFQGGGTEEQLREGYLRRLELEGLGPREDDQPLRILEVGVGSGANIPRIRRTLTPGLRVELWGVDLSPSMLGLLHRRARSLEDGSLRLALADAHALPFQGGTFDRVFHVGGINGYGDPALALREMARVARPATPVVVVDEQLDPSRRHTLYHRLMFRMVTFYDQDPHCPLELVPAGASDVREEQVSRFFYCLSFRTPASPSGA
jgi:SAM-dependent methyltransferase